MTAATATGRRAVGLLLILVMAAGSIFMWLGIPVGLIYGASQLQASSGDPSMGIYVGLAILIPAGMFGMARVLSRVDRLYGQVTGTADETPVRANWLRSMRAERGSTHKTSILDVVMVLSVALALLAMAIWFFGFAGSSLPGGA